MKEQSKYQTMDDGMTKSFIWPLFNRVLHILLIVFFSITFILGDIDELLDRRNAIRGRAFFTQKVIPRELSITPEIDKYLDMLELLSQHGLFIRILLPELRDYPGRTHRKIARQTHLEQMEAFINLL